MIFCPSIPGLRLVTPRCALAVAVLAALAGCTGQDKGEAAAATGAAAVRVATCWTRADRDEIEHELRSQHRASGPFSLSWIDMPESAPLSRLTDHLPQVDVFLGGPLTEYEVSRRPGNWKCSTTRAIARSPGKYRDGR